MASSTPRAPRNLSGTSKAAANAPPFSDLKNRCAPPFSAEGFTKPRPWPSARKFTLVSMPLPPLARRFGFQLGDGSPLPPPFWWLLLYLGSLCSAPPTPLLHRPPQPLRSLS